MPPRFSIRTDPDVDVRGALVVVGAPGVGLVGHIASGYVRRNLDLTFVGGLYSAALQANAPVESGIAVPPIRFHAMEKGNDKLVVIEMNATPPAEHADEVASTLAQWAVNAGCSRMVIVDGVMVDREELDDKVWGAASDAKGVAFLRSCLVELVERGTVGGFSGILLNAGAAAGLQSLCLLAEAAPGAPDSKAAARVVEIVDTMLPGTIIEVGPLVAEADAVDLALREAQARLSSKAAAKRP